jgi:hypothetical protein
MGEFRVQFLSRHRKASCDPNPDYPEGIDVDNGMRPACQIRLPYPAECVGLWYVECLECQANMLLTTAGRIDDPRSVALPCRQNLKLI